MPPEVRAEALRVLLALGSGTPYLDPVEALGLGLPSLVERDVAVMELAQDEDVALANECLLLECELRERAYAALSRLGMVAYAAGEEADLDERLRTLPVRGFAAAAECLIELGWDRS
jgi:hypothetical protein